MELHLTESKTELTKCLLQPQIRSDPNNCWSTKLFSHAVLWLKTCQLRVWSDLSYEACYVQHSDLREPGSFLQYYALREISISEVSQQQWRHLRTILCYCLVTWTVWVGVNVTISLRVFLNTHTHTHTHTFWVYIYTQNSSIILLLTNIFLLCVVEFL